MATTASDSPIPTTVVPSPDGAVDRDILNAAVRSMKEWSRVAIFDDAGTVVASTFTADPADIQKLLHAWDERDATVGEGLVLDGHFFDVHRWYDTLIYGRRGDSGEGEGIAMHKLQNENSKKTMYAIITYGFPMLSARAVPMLVDFCKKFVAKLQ